MKNRLLTFFVIICQINAYSQNMAVHMDSTLLKMPVCGIDSITFVNDTTSEVITMEKVREGGLIVNGQQIETSNEQHVGNCLDATRFFGKDLVVLGSSSATDYYRTWSQDLCSELGMNWQSVGIGAAIFPMKDGYLVSSNLKGIADQHIGEVNSLILQVNHLLENEYSPDYIVIYSGMNEAAQNPIVGDFDRVISMSADEIEWSDDVDVNLYSVMGAMKWCIEKLKNRYPDAQIVPIIPWQCGNMTYCTNFRNKYMEPMMKMYNYFSLPSINAFDNGAFFVDELDPKKGVPKYTIDYIHVKIGGNINERGRKVQRNFIVKEFIQKVYNLF